MKLLSDELGVDPVRLRFRRAVGLDSQRLTDEDMAKDLDVRTRFHWLRHVAVQERELMRRRMLDFRGRPGPRQGEPGEGDVA
jgi:hypothetical protein